MPEVFLARFPVSVKSARAGGYRKPKRNELFLFAAREKKLLVPRVFFRTCSLQNKLGEPPLFLHFWHNGKSLRKSQCWKIFARMSSISTEFDGFISPFAPWVLFRLRRYIKHSRQCFIGYANTSNSVKNTPPRVIFSALFSVLISR